MKRFLMLLAVAVVAGGMYAAAAIGSHQAAGPTAKQFAALKRQVVGINRKLAAVSKLAKAEAVLLAACDSKYASIDQYGGPNGAAPEGYLYSHSPIGTDEKLTTALDIAPYSDPLALWIAGGGKACGNVVASGGLRQAAAAAGVTLSHASAHVSFRTVHTR